MQCVAGESKGMHISRVSPFLQVADQLCAKYSKEYGKLCRTNQIGTVNDRVMYWWNSCSQLELPEQTCMLWLSASFSCGQWLMPVAHCRVGWASCAAGGQPALEHGSIVLRSLAGGALLCWLWTEGSRACGALACGCQQPPLWQCCTGRKDLPKAALCSLDQVALAGIELHCAAPPWSR